MSDPTPLYNNDAERALISAAIIQPSIIDQVNIRASDFYLNRLQYIWNSLQRISKRGVVPDFVTLTDDLNAVGDLDKIGGAAFLAELIGGNISSLNYKGYAETVRSYSVRRKALAAATNIAKAAYDLDNNLHETVAEIIGEFSKANAPTSGAQHISLSIGELVKDVETRYKSPVDVWGIQTGFLDIDSLLGGLQTSEVVYIAGEPGAGKSKLSMQIGVQTALSGVGTAIYSLEMKALAVIRRMVSGLAEIPTRNLKTGKLLETEYTKFFVAVQELETMPLYITDQPDWTLEALRSDCWRLKNLYNVKVVILDYLLLMGGYDRLDEPERAAKLSSGIKGIARSLDMAFVTVNSVTKEGMDTLTASMKHVKGSGQTIHDADVIAQLFKPDKAGIAKLVFTKTREVELGTLSIELKAEAKFPIFRNLAKVHTEEALQWYQK